MTREPEAHELELDGPGLQFDEAAAAPVPDTLFQALAKQKRRRLLGYLLEVPGASVGELADVLAGWRATESTVVTESEREQIVVELRHVHLPMLAGADIVAYDSDAEAVRLVDLPTPVAEVIRFANEYERAVEGQQ